MGEAVREKVFKTMKNRSHIINLRKDFKMFWISSIAIVICLLVSAVLQLNAYIHQNTLAKDYEKRITELTADSETLEVQLSSNNSLENFNKFVMTQAANYELVEVEKIKYIKAPGDQLVKK